MLRVSSRNFYLASTSSLLSRMQRKSISIDPHNSDGNVGNSFEKIVDDIGNAMPFKVTQDMYDKPFTHNDYQEHPEAYHSATSGIDAANAQLSGKEHESPRTPRERYYFDKVYDPAVLRTSTCSPDHYYPPPPTREEIQRRMKVRQMWIVGVVGLVAILFVLDIILPKIKAATPQAGRK
jgi:hypothetical protein